MGSAPMRAQNLGVFIIMSYRVASFAAFAALSMTATPALAIQDTVEDTVEIECPENLADAPEAIRVRCNAAIEEAMKAGTAANSTFVVAIPVAVLAAAGIVIAASDEDRPVSR